MALLGAVLGASSTELPSRLFTGLPAQPHDTAEFWLRASPLQMHTLTPVPSGLQDFFCPGPKASQLISTAVDIAGVQFQPARLDVLQPSDEHTACL